MKRNLLNRLHAVWIACICTVSLAPTAWAEVAPKTPPRFPAKFDRDATQKLLDAIEQDKNSEILAYGYFLRNRRQTLSPPDALAMVKAALMVEAGKPLVTKKWFALQSLYALASFHVKGGLADEGFKAYNSVFERASDARKVGAQELLAHTVSQYVLCVNGQFRNLGIVNDSRSRETLLQAWDAYSAGLADKASNFPEPLWMPAIEATRSTDSFAPLVEQSLANPLVPKTPKFLQTAAYVLSATKPNEAIRLLEKAKEQPALSTSHDLTDVYTDLVSLLLAQGRTAEASKVLREQIEVTGSGQADLTLLAWRLKDETQLKQALSFLQEPGTAERDINRVAEKFWESYTSNPVENAQSGSLMITVLSSYLDAKRTREVSQELRARLMLGSVYRLQDKEAEAIRVLNVEHLKPLIKTSMARSYLQRVQQMSQFSPKESIKK